MLLNMLEGGCLFLFKYFSTRSDDDPVQEVKKFFVITFTHPYRAGSIMMRGGNPQV